MSRQLLILRHAKSAWDTDAPSDFERPLTKRGKADAIRIGYWLRQQGLIPDHIISSPARRAEKTAIKACRAMGIEKKQISWSPSIYDADSETLLEILAGCPQSARIVLLVGHNPGLEHLLIHLCADTTAFPDDGKLLPTATVAQLQLPELWDRLEEGAAKLLSITRPGSLP